MAAILCWTEQPKFFGVWLSAVLGQVFRPVVAAIVGMGV